MGIAGQISVLMTVNSSQYTAGFQAARISNTQLAASANATGLSISRLRFILNEVTKANFQALSPQQQLSENLRGLRALYDADVFSLGEYNKAKESFIRNTNAARFSLESFLKPLGVLKTVLIGVTAARLFGAVFESGGSAFGFESQIKRATAVFEEVSDLERRQIRGAARQAGFDLTTKVNFVDAAAGLEQLGRDGQKASEAVQNIIPLLQFAQAAQLDVATAAELSSDVYTAFGLKVDDQAQRIKNLADVYDTLVKASLSADVTVQQLAESLIKAAPLFRTLQIGIQEATALQTVLAELGRKGFVGGEEAQRGVRDLLRVFSEQRDLFTNFFNVDFFDAEGQFVGIIQALRKFETLFEGLNPEQRLEFIRGLGFEERAVRTIQQLLGQSSAVEKALENLNDRGGVTKQLSEESQTSLEQLNKLLGSMFQLLTSIAVVAPLETLAKILFIIGQNVRNLFEYLNFLTFGALYPLLRALAVVTTGVFVFGASLGVVTLIAAMTKNIILLTTVMQGAASAIGFLRFAFENLALVTAIVRSVLGGPVGLIVTLGSLAAGVGSAIAVAKAFDEITISANKANEAVSELQKQPVFKGLTPGQDEIVTSLQNDLDMLRRLRQLRQNPITGRRFTIGGVADIRERQFFHEIDLVRDPEGALDLTIRQLSGRIQYFKDLAARQAIASVGFFFDETGKALDVLATQKLPTLFEEAEKRLESIRTPAQKAALELKELLAFFEKIDKVFDKRGDPAFKIFGDDVRKRLIADTLDELATDFGKKVHDQIANAGALVRGDIDEVSSRFEVRTSDEPPIELAKLDELKKLNSNNKTGFEDLKKVIQDFIDQTPIETEAVRIKVKGTE